MTERIVVVGAGGFGRETLDVIEALNAEGRTLHVVGVIDAGPRPIDLDRLAERDIAYLGTEEQWLPHASGSECFVVAIGAPSVRVAVAGRLADAGLRPTTLIHPRAVIGSRARIGDGVVVTSVCRCRPT